LVAARWMVAGRWPNVDALQPQLTRRGDLLDVLSGSAKLPPRLGRVSEERRVLLTVRGLDRLPMAADLLKEYLRVVRLAFERYGSGSDAQIQWHDLRSSLKLSKAQAIRVGELMDVEVELFERTAGTGNHRPWRVRSTARFFGEVQTVSQYLQALDRCEKQRPEATNHRPGDQAPRHRPHRRFVRDVAVGCVVTFTGLGAHLLLEDQGVRAPPAPAPTPKSAPRPSQGSTHGCSGGWAEPRTRPKPDPVCT
jgi:hypothetical protein